MQLKEFKIRCSAIGEIMAGEIGLTPIQDARLNELQERRNGVGKPLTPNMDKELDGLIIKRDNPELPKGAKTYCQKWIKKQAFGADEFWKSKVIDKGLAVEETAIKLIGQVYGIDVFKNEEFFINDWCHGEPDMLTFDTVRDNKSSWDLLTYPMFEEDIPKKEYWWQLQGYMWLTGLKKASLDYTLIDTPMPLVLLDLKKLYFQSGGCAEDWTPERYESMYPHYRFDNVPLEMRVKSFEFTFEEWVPEQIIYRVELCREYISKLTSTWK